MQARTSRRWLTAAALAIAPVLASNSVYGQYAAGRADGHALDANNGVGSGGYNTPGRNGSLVTGNDIVYGNVTGGRGLTGNLHSSIRRRSGARCQDRASINSSAVQLAHPRRGSQTSA